MAGDKAGGGKRRREEVSQVTPLMISSMEQSNHHLLPQDIIAEEILTRLPVKSLFKFRCVCKSWLSLISSSRFIKTHLIKNSKSKYYANHKAIIQTTDSYTNHYTYYAQSINSILDDPVSPMNLIEQIVLPTSPPIYSFESLPISSCNGLLCLYPQQNTYIIFNPSLKKFHKLPFSGIHHIDAYKYTDGFGYDETNDDYKLVKVFGVCNPGPNNDGAKNYTTKIYSLKNNCWRNIKNQPIGPFITPVSGVLVSGKLHWATYGGPNVFLSLDMATEEFGMVAQPKHGYGAGVSVFWFLVESRGLLYSFASVDSKNFMEVWEMTEYGVEEESWTKLGTIPYFTDLCPLTRFFPFFVKENGVVLLKSSVCTVFYDLKCSKFGGHKVYDNNWHDGSEACLYPLPYYIESLVPPNFDG